MVLNFLGLEPACTFWFFHTNCSYGALCLLWSFWEILFLNLENILSHYGPITDNWGFWAFVFGLDSPSLTVVSPWELWFKSPAAVCNAGINCCLSESINAILHRLTCGQMSHNWLSRHPQQDENCQSVGQHKHCPYSSQKSEPSGPHWSWGCALSLWPSGTFLRFPIVSLQASHSVHVWGKVVSSLLHTTHFPPGLGAPNLTIYVWSRIWRCQTWSPRYLHSHSFCCWLAGTTDWEIRKSPGNGIWWGRSWNRY